MPRKIAAGNWKMNGTPADLAMLGALTPAAGVETVLCLPATLLGLAQKGAVALGGEDCHAKAKGAHTGDISAAMLADVGATYVIVGHSERRTDHGETDADVKAKAEAALAAGLTPIVCIGETEAQYRAGETLDVLKGQLDGSLPSGEIVIAYEPVWAIGTGLTPTVDEIGTVHSEIRSHLGAAHADTPLLYGGSVKAGNAAEIFGAPNVDGALVGGASLKVEDFQPIVDALSAAG